MSVSSASAIARSRSAAAAPDGTATSPHSMTAGRSPETITSAYPIPVVPGSIPRTVVPGSIPRTVRGPSLPEDPPRRELRVLEHLFGYVEVRVDPLYVVQVLERLHEADELTRGLAFDPHGGRRPHGQLGGGRADPRRLERLLHAFEGGRRRVHGDEAPVGLHVFGARVDRGELDGVGTRALRVDLDDALLLEQPLDRAGFAELSAVLGERRSDLGHGAIPVVGRDLDHHRHAARRVALVHDALQDRALAAARRAVDRPLDVLPRHVHAARSLDREAKAEVAVGIAAAFLRGEHDLLGHLGEKDAPRDGRRTLLSLDLTPL